MAETYALISSAFDQEDGIWYLYMKPHCIPMIIFHKKGQHGIDVRECHRKAGWSIRPLTVFAVDDKDIN